MNVWAIKSKHAKLLLCVLVVLIGFGLRFWRLGTLPAEMHRDEVAIGYNAYSLAKTGHDEHGVAWPVNFTSFGDYKLPGMIYTVIGTIQVFGLNAFAVRLPTAIASVATLVAVFWLSREMGWSKRVSFVAMLLLTLAYWHITQARNTYEPMVGLFFSVAGWASWLAGRRRRLWYAGALGAYLAGSLFYNLPFLLMPILFVVTWATTEQPLKKWRRRQTWLSAWPVLVAGLVGVGLSLLFQSSNTGKSGITIFMSKDILDLATNSVHAMLIGGVPSRIARMVDHVNLFSTLQFFKGYFSVFNPAYVFFTGDPNSWHNLRSIGLGNSNPVLLIPFGIGMLTLLKQRSKQSAQLLLAYLLLSPIVSALTIDSPVTNRLLDFHLAITLVAAVGVTQLYDQLWKSQSRVRKTVFGFGVALYVGMFGVFGLRYFFSYNQLLPTEWSPGMTDMMAFVQANSAKYDWVYITPDLDLAYIHFAFHTPFDPQTFQTAAVWKKNGFEFVEQYQKYRFQHFDGFNYLDPSNVAELFDDQHRRILLMNKGEPDPKTNLIWTDVDWGGRWLWYAREVDLDQAIALFAAQPPAPKRDTLLQYLRSCQAGRCDYSLVGDVGVAPDAQPIQP